MDTEDKRNSSFDVKQKNRNLSPLSRKPIDRRNWKLISDPALGKGPEKIYRFDGLIPEVILFALD